MSRDVNARLGSALNVLLPLIPLAMANRPVVAVAATNTSSKSVLLAEKMRLREGPVENVDFDRVRCPSRLR